MEKETVFAAGLSFFLPNPNSPDYVKGRLSINPGEFIAFLRENKQHLRGAKGRDGQPTQVFTIDLKVSQKGNGYASLNTWRPEPRAEAFDKTPDPVKTYAPSYTPSAGYPDEMRPEDVPF